VNVSGNVKNGCIMNKKVGCSCGVIFSGNANNSANAGFSYANSNNTPSVANTNIRSHLCFSKVKYKIQREQRPCRSAKDNNLKWALVGKPKTAKVKSKA
jgi:hypothetical protein